MAWTNPTTSIISWLVVIEGQRVFTVRQTQFPPESTNAQGEGLGSSVVCLDLSSGATLWERRLPFAGNDGTLWIAGVGQGRLYVSRALRGGELISKPITALNAATGATLWTSAASVDAGAYDGCIVAPDGDLIVGGFRTLTRINAEDGATVWSRTRTCVVSGRCGPVLGSSAVYIADLSPTGGFNNTVRRYDPASGLESAYNSGPVPGFTFESPLMARGARVYFPRAQNNASVDFFYAWDDTGSAFTPLFNVPAGYSAVAELAATDQHVFMLSPTRTIQKRDAVSGSLAGESAFSVDSYAPRLAVDGEGRLFGVASVANAPRIFSLNADMTTRWNIAASGSPNIGGPAFGPGGFLVVATSTGITAFRTPACAADCDGNGSLSPADFTCFLAKYRAGDPGADCDGGGGLSPADFTCFLAKYRAGCP